MSIWLDPAVYLVLTALFLYIIAAQCIIKTVIMQKTGAVLKDQRISNKG
jgi:hypothetical protein